jgi:hypothetical protein
MTPLEDVRIIAVEQYGAGPFGSVHLADLGADVIKIEDPASGGDIGRYVPPMQEEEDSLFFETFNRNKRSISLDLRTPGGRAVFHDLVRVSDVVFSNLRGDVPEALRINYADLEHLNKRIVCCALTGFGMTGPRRSEPGYDYFLQGIAGWMDLTGEPGGPPTKSGLSVVDYSAGLVAAISILAGIHAARRDGVGMDCDVSLFDTALGMLTATSLLLEPITLRIHRWFRSRPSRRATDGSWLGARRRSSGCVWSTQSGVPNLRRMRASRHSPIGALTRQSSCPRSKPCSSRERRRSGWPFLAARVSPAAPSTRCPKRCAMSKPAHAA